MSKQALLGLVLLAALTVGCKSSMQSQGEVRPAATPPATASAPAVTPAPTATTALAPSAPPADTGYEVLVLKADLPRDLLDEAEGKGTCPSSVLTNLFGVTFSNMHGCVIGEVTPGGLADKAGLKAKDSIVKCNGGEVTCPRTLEPLLFSPQQPNTIELVIHRPLR